VFTNFGNIRRLFMNIHSSLFALAA